MCPFWKRSSVDSTLEKEKAILKQIHDSGVIGIAFEGGEPLLRKDLVRILAFSRSLSLHTSLVTNGTLLESRINEIASYINGVIYVSLDGLEKTHDTIRGVSGCFRKAIAGIIASKDKASVTINTTIMEENLNEVEDIVRLAKELNTGISVALAHEYCNANLSSPTVDEVADMVKRLVEMKRDGYPLVNSINYFRVMAKEKSWRCRPWTVINVDPKGDLVLPCYTRNEYMGGVSVLETDIRTAISGFNWEGTRNCEECSLHCYVEPSLVLSQDFGTYRNWASRVRI
jgi:MoaA/NifB/PqqE/SkfB family radical SAM enzyme